MQQSFVITQQAKVKQCMQSNKSKIHNTRKITIVHNVLMYAIICCVLSGCAARFGKRSQNVTFNSTPRGARVYLDNKFVGVTPVTVFIPIHHQYHEILQKKQELEEGTISKEDFLLFKKAIYKVSYIKEELDPIEFYIQPEGSKYAPNRKLCIFDAIYSPILLLTPLIVDIAGNYCKGFDKVYHKSLLAKSANIQNRGQKFGLFGS